MTDKFDEERIEVLQDYITDIWPPLEIFECLLNGYLDLKDTLTFKRRVMADRSDWDRISNELCDLDRKLATIRAAISSLREIDTKEEAEKWKLDDPQTRREMKADMDEREHS